MIVALRSAVLHILLRVETVSLVIREEIRVPKKVLTVVLICVALISATPHLCQSNLTFNSMHQ